MTMKKRMAEVLADAIAVVEDLTDVDDHEKQMPWAVSLASSALLAESIELVRNALDRLGNADAATPMGAIEAASKHLGEQLAMVGSEIAQALRDRSDKE